MNIQNLQSRVSEIREQSECSMFARELPVDDDNFNEKFMVVNPIHYGNIVKYTVKGEDEKGPFESYRRFNEFFALQ